MRKRKASKLCTLCKKPVPIGRVNKCSDACRKKAADGSRRRRWTASLVKQLANALVKTWGMLPGDLSLVYTEMSSLRDEEATTREVLGVHDQAMRALARAEASGWKRPR